MADVRLQRDIPAPGIKRSRQAVAWVHLPAAGRSCTFASHGTLYLFKRHAVRRARKHLSACACSQPRLTHVARVVRLVATMHARLTVKRPPFADNERVPAAPRPFR